MRREQRPLIINAERGRHKCDTRYPTSHARRAQPRSVPPSARAITARSLSEKGKARTAPERPGQIAQRGAPRDTAAPGTTRGNGTAPEPPRAARQRHGGRRFGKKKRKLFRNASRRSETRTEADRPAHLLRPLRRLLPQRLFHPGLHGRAHPPAAPRTSPGPARSARPGPAGGPSAPARRGGAAPPRRPSWRGGRERPESRGGRGAGLRCAALRADPGSSAARLRAGAARSPRRRCLPPAAAPHRAGPGGGAAPAVPSCGKLPAGARLPAPAPPPRAVPPAGWQSAKPRGRAESSASPRRRFFRRAPRAERGPRGSPGTERGSLRPPPPPSRSPAPLACRASRPERKTRERAL